MRKLSFQQRIQQLDKLATKLHLYSIASDDDVFTATTMEKNQEVQQLIRNALRLMTSLDVPLVGPSNPSNTLESEISSLNATLRSCQGISEADFEKVANCAQSASATCRHAALKASSSIPEEFNARRISDPLYSISSQLMAIHKSLTESSTPISPDKPKLKDKYPPVSMSLQRKLLVTVDGKLGPETEEAIRQAKKEKGLPPTATLKELENALDKSPRNPYDAFDD